MPDLLCRDEPSESEDEVHAMTRDNNETRNSNRWPGLNPPELKTGDRIGGSNKRQHRRENKAK
eukprot:scaffold12427_cov51-Cyclotella_meneghiniana.AAC.7